VIIKEGAFSLNLPAATSFGLVQNAAADIGEEPIAVLPEGIRDTPHIYAHIYKSVIAR
jgi:hypothetical protein